ncbi:TIGR03086 family metal-binding protein [Fodinicola acaciae]|uniref:TIGR03086 family metal-binding protein n=1 Tax=Fodinicola acaciae TaxID=2681555 RepID=UPI0013D06A53|nr:TIGR03086 family metal-binding protein [Fodinicola acaciae]
MQTATAYKRAQDGFDTVLAKIGADQWDQPSTCAEWTIRDVAGHVIWAQLQLRAWATGEEFHSATGFPGSPHPGELTGDDPVATFRDAREKADATLTDESLRRMLTLPGLGTLPVAGMVELLVTDFLAHSWDIGHAAGLDVRLDPELLPGALEWSREHLGGSRQPGYFGPPVPVAPDADEQTKLLAFLGREPGQHLS